MWIREWLNHVDDHLNKNDTRKAFMYASHDLNVAYILVALDNFDDEIPHYGGCLMFELHEEDDEYYVQVQTIILSNVLLAIWISILRETFNISKRLFEFLHVILLYMQVLYRNKGNVRTLKFPNCDKMCTLEGFRKFVTPVIPTSPKAVCG